MDVAIHLKRLPGDEAGTSTDPPFTLLQTGFTKLHKSPYGLVRFYRTVSPVQHFRYCSLLSVALSIASPLLGVTQHPALRSPDFPHPDSNTTIETRPSTQLKPFYYTLFNNLITTKSEYPYQFEIVCQFDYGGGIFKSLQIFSTSHLPISLWRGTEVKICPSQMPLTPP